ncbi:MAG: ABC transporter ATP-binding protein [Candidatus Cloacimonadota bacterium]|nr:ABC transporter ATP-binding protein [Candidatus Cloacimonadota bacterium]
MAKNEFKEQEYTKQFDYQLWLKVGKFALKYWKHLLFIAIAMLAVAGIDAYLPLMTKKAIDNFIVPQKSEGIGNFAIFYLALIVVQALSVFFFIVLAGKVEVGIIYDIKRAGFVHLQKLSLSYYNKTPVGWLMARLTSDCMNLGSTIAWGMVDFVWGGTMMGAISFIMFKLNWKLALIVFAVIPPLAIVSLYFQKIILKSYRNVRKINSKITGSFNEGISGAQTTKTLLREADNFTEFSQLTDKMYNSSVAAAIKSSLFQPLVLFIGSIGSALALWFGGNGVIGNVVSYGVLVAFITYMIRFFEPIRELARIFSEFQNAQASAERIFSLLETKPEIIDNSEIAEFNNHVPQKIVGDVKFVNITFEYKGGEKVFDNFNLDIKAGETVAIVGETGAGKSTLVNLLARFYEPDSGKILIDEHDYIALPLQFIQSNVSLVLQTPHLFSGTIADNIRYGKLTASEKDIKQAAKIVYADGFISKLKDGYDTEVGEGGSLLSLGQKQLITFARAIISDPAILILDEATSSVDTETEMMIQMALENILWSRTSIIIAHRLSTIKSADRIIVIEHGEIIEMGKHNELIKQKGRYHNLYTNQFIDESDSFL